MRDIIGSEAIDAARQGLRSTGWLSVAPDAFADRILGECRLVRFDKGDTVYRLGDPPTGLFGIVSGNFAIEQNTLERGPAFSGLYTQGAWFGETELFDHRERRATVVATRDGSCLHLSRARFMQIVSEDPGAWRWLGALSAQRLQSSLMAIDDMTLAAPSARIVATLLQLGNVRRLAGMQSTRPTIDVTQSDIARLTTYSRSTVAVHLNALEEEGFICRSYAQITLVDPVAMQKMLEQELARD